MTEDPRFEKVRHRISDWLLAEGWKVSGTTDKAEGAAWAIQGTDPRGRVVILGQDPRRPDVLVLHAPILVGESDRARLAALSPEENAVLGWNLRFQLLNMGLQFSGLALPLERIVLVLRMYTDDLARNDFFDRLDRLQSGILAVIWMIRRTLDQPVPEEPTDGLGIN